MPEEVAAEIRAQAVVATRFHREVLVRRMQDAVEAYERGRFEEAARLAKSVGNEVPLVPAVRRLAGLAAYKSGRWREAVRQLESYQSLTGDLDETATLMDCYRALKRKKKVADLWAELRQRSPGPDELAEARMVVAAMLADSGDLEGAISLLNGAGASKTMRNPAERHIRQWYLLGDLYERAGDVPRARQLFLRVLRTDPDAYDVPERLDSLGRQRKRTPAARKKTTTKEVRPSKTAVQSGAR